MTSVASRQDHDDSGEYSEGSQENDQNISGNEGEAPESDYDSRGSESDLSEQDPNINNQETERKVDHDEDRSNPQYIPKRGTFYEHDDRTAASGEESANTTSEGAGEKKEEGEEVPAERRRPPRKSEVISRWSHDKYNENEQVPKSRDELVSMYGYDIRNEDGPPHARRNRRYGRGPNKYTRTWEDEEAYRRQQPPAAPAAPSPLHRKPPNPEDFPELDTSGKRIRSKRPPRPRSKSQPSSEERTPPGPALRRNASIKAHRGNNNKATERPNQSVRAPQPMKPVSPFSKSVQVNKNIATDHLPPIENLTITTNVHSNGSQRKVAAVAQQRPVATAQGKKPTPPTQPQQPPVNNNTSRTTSPPTVQQQQQQQTSQQQNNQQQNERGGGSKRYSSLRQRPIAESYAPQQHRYHPEYTGVAPPTSAPAQLPTSQLNSAQLGPSQINSPQLGTSQLNPPQLGSSQINSSQLNSSQMSSQQLASTQPQIHPQQQQIMHQANRPTGVSHGQSPPLRQPHSQQVRIGMMDQQQLVPHPHPHQLHNIPPPQPHNMGQVQPAQGYVPPAMMPPQYMQPVQGGGGGGGVYPGGLYPAAGGYPPPLYHNYHPSQGGVTYYNPPEQELPPLAPRPPAARRPTAAIPIVKPHPPDRQVSSGEKDIDRIVENMFVRKPWPATHSNESKEKSQSEIRSSQESTKDQSQPNSMTSSISSDSRPSAERSEPNQPENRIEHTSQEPGDVTDKNQPIESTRAPEDAESIELVESNASQQEVQDPIAVEA